MVCKRAVVTAIAMATTVLGLAGTGVAVADSTPQDEMKAVLRDYRAHAGERFQVHGLVYSDAANWTLAFITGGPTEFYTLNGARAELTGARMREVTQGDEFTGTITVTGRSGNGDPEVTLDEVRVVGHQTQPMH
ncbi:hypothetical protein [Nocardia inohanensis]|uniref:hypothetical protein n=1 Tax=Nocardia inohanensis TaxID=209246 RepID=UPI00082CA061|nr:hypothetical protein [Nocardia inohanensis]